MQISQLKPQNVVIRSRRKNSKVATEHNRLDGDVFAGFMKMSLAGENNYEFVRDNLVMTGDWQDPVKRTQILKEEKGSNTVKVRRYRLNFHLFDMDGNKREIIPTSITTPVTLEGMTQILDTIAQQLYAEMTWQIDFRKSYVVVRA